MVRGDLLHFLISLICVEVAISSISEPEQVYLRRRLKDKSNKLSNLISSFEDWLQGSRWSESVAEGNRQPVPSPAPSFIIPLQSPTHPPTFIIPIPSPTHAPSIQSSNVLPTTPVLGSAGFTNKIVGGQDAQPSEAPFFVLMLTWNPGFGQWESRGCGGTLVSNIHVLTAAHCAIGRNASNDAVYVSAFQPYYGNTGVPYHFSKLESYLIHPDFSNVNNRNDLAIAKMAVPIDITQFAPIQPVPPTVSVYDGEMVQIFGFGRLAQNQQGRVSTLQTAELPFITRSTCQKFFGSHILPDMVCAGYPQGGVDACYGDSGGPMTLTVGGVLLQLALVSWGEGCAQPNKPGVYCSLQYHYSWLQSTICGSTGVNRTIALCQKRLTATSYSFVLQDRAAQTDSPTKASTRPSPSECFLQQLGTSCLYGGQCCSGICGYSSASSGLVCID